MPHERQRHVSAPGRARGCDDPDRRIDGGPDRARQVQRPIPCRHPRRAPGRGWLATLVSELELGDRTIHLRGLHYAAIGRPKPDGTPYTNTEKDWLWLSSGAAKAARFLGYIRFDQIADQRNAPPVTRIFKRPELRRYITVGVDVDIPEAEDLHPQVSVEGFSGVQPYKLVLIGEKSSLEPVLAPLAASYQADLYLPTGEPSDTMLYQMARIGAEDGRPMVVQYFSDCDPSGWQMPLSVSRKLQAFKEGLFPGLEFEVYRAALTPGQVREYELPSTPLKETESRADKWQQAWGVAQTEIDALASLRPDLLRQIARAALDPFFDRTLGQRVHEAQSQWLEAAQAVVDAATGTEELQRIRAAAAERLEDMREEIDAINDALRIDVTGFDLPPIVVPHAEIGGVASDPPLIDSRWDFAWQCRALIDSKAYRKNGSAG
jgi:hypothetical protein